jgi:hypothetical protein
MACNGLRRGYSARLNFSGAVQRRMTAQATFLDFWLDGGGLRDGEAAR